MTQVYNLFTVTAVRREHETSVHATNFRTAFQAHYPKSISRRPQRSHVTDYNEDYVDLLRQRDDDVVVAMLSQYRSPGGSMPRAKIA